MTHTLRTILAILALILLCVACADSGEPAPPAPAIDEVAFDSPVYYAPAEGGEIAISLTASGEWTVVPPSDSKFLHGYIETTGGAAGRGEICFRALPNTSGTEQITRMGVVCGRASADVEIRHPAVDIEPMSEDEVRAYLVRLYHAVGGPDTRLKNPKWLSDLPINQWGSEVHYENGRLSLYLSEYKLSGKIDLSGCRALYMLKCSKNSLTAVDVSGCPQLETLDVASNQIADLNISGCLSLKTLSASTNPPLSNPALLRDAYAMQYADVSAGNFSSLDLTGCYSLQTLACWRNYLTELDLPDSRRLEVLWCWGNRLRSLAMHDYPQLRLLNCGQNEISELTISGCPKLGRLFCYENQLSTIDISALRDVLGEFYCYSNRLERLDVTGCHRLSHLHVSDNWLTELDLTGCKGLGSLYAELNRLTSITFDPETSLVNCYLTSNRLTSIPLEHCHYGGKVWVRDNPVLAEIPEAADDFAEFEHDARYEYDRATGRVTDLKRGWWYPGEPESGKHARR
ncbi:MAG: hypothetical protein NC406_00975 [Bacteroides sp.]|nr:hypothetical protein [Bacteroides sp.]MCM1095334.1 hypothetical protein [Terasakiella sp.]